MLVGVLSCVLPASMEKRTGAPGQIEHVFAYFCTAAALTLAYPRSSRLKLMVGLIVYAAMLEAGQLYVPGRMAQVIDWAASGLGAVLGMVAITRLIKYDNEHQLSPMNSPAVRLQPWVTAAGLEPAPLSFEARCSIRLSDAAESERKVKATSIV